MPRAPSATSIVPTSSVRRIVAPTAASRSTTSADGWPWVLAAPTEMAARAGRVAATSAWPVDVRLP